VTKTVVATRTHQVNGVDVVADTRKVSLQVETTNNLRDQQGISVSWTGAHPSANISLDPNSESAFQAEYPMVLLQCRGTDSASAPVSEQVSPQTCWTPFYGTRSQLNNQGEDNRNIDVGAFPAWRLDRYASQADRQQFANEPATTAPLCPNSHSAAEYRLPFRAANGKLYYGSSGVNSDSFCGPPPPEAAAHADQNSAIDLPDNATFAATRADGSGSALFNIRDNQTNASLGCSSTVACTLVAIPILGISCDGGAGLPAADRPAATAMLPNLPQDAETECERAGNYPAGSPQVTGNPQQDYSVSGSLWWSASNWRNRISIPLQLAPPSNVCDLVSTKTPVNVYGSELLVQASTQWSARFCLDKQRSPFKHVQFSEPQARNLLAAGTIEAAFTSYSATNPYPTPTVHAPVAATGFALSYTIDDTSKHAYTKLRLTPRLLAKLLTESYPFAADLRQMYRVHDPYYGDINPLKNNPLNITFDPEFQALNPGIPASAADVGGRAALLSIGSNSDVAHALTAYINADPEARAWLDGKPDPWGMVVNPNYRGISLPVETMPGLDSFTYPAKYGAEDSCTFNVDPPVPFLPLVSAPIARLVDIAQSVQYAVPGSQTRCTNARNDLTNTNYFQWTRAQKQTPGFRFLIGVTSLGDARRYGLNTASLQSYSTADAATKFTDDSGRSFVAPTDDALRQTAALMKFAQDSTGWPVPYDQLDSKAGAAAYPGLMLIYADIPTRGLPAKDAAAYAAMLKYIVDGGQQPGSGAGQLPAGFLPLTAANGLGSLADYSLHAADLVAAQGGGAMQSPGGSAQPPVAQPASASPSSSVQAASGRSAPQPTSTSTSTVAGKSSAAPRPSAAAPSRTPALRSLGNTVGQSDFIGRNLALLLIALVLFGPVAVPTTLVIARRRGGR
jgi:hypothetical protein